MKDTIDKKDIDNVDYEKTIDELLEKRKKDRIIKIILIIIIIILLLLSWILCYRIGKIGYGSKSVIANPEISDEEKITIIKVMQEDMQITKDTQLDIFNNSKFNGEKIIAPNSSGSYKFCISNEAPNDIIYNIKFLDEMNYFINMKYRLKIDNVYIRGNENEYIGIDELNVEDITVLEDSNNIFTLEWCWVNNDKQDTLVGMQKDNQYYTLKLKINADKFNGRK